MPNGNWRTILAIGLAVSGLAFGLGGWIIYRANHEQALYQSQRQKGSDSQANITRIAVQHCLRLPAHERYDCTRQEIEAGRQAQHDEADLEAQMVTSVWTHYMGLAAIGGTAFGIIGIFLVLATFRENKRAADAAIIAATATAEALYGVERPVIIISMPQDRPGFAAGALCAEFYVDLKNVGEQVGTVFGVSGRFVVTADPQKIPELNSFGGPPEELCTSLTVGEAFFEPDGLPTMVILQRSRLTEAEILGLRDRTLLGFFVAGVLYSDPLHKMRKLTVLFLYEPPTPGAPHGRFIQLLHGETRNDKADQSVRLNAFMQELRDSLPIIWQVMKAAAKDDFKEPPKKTRWYQRLWRGH